MTYDKKRLYCGDNLEILATLEKESVDLIYIDPPFKNNQDYNVPLDRAIQLLRRCSLLRPKGYAGQAGKAVR